MYDPSAEWFVISRKLPHQKNGWINSLVVLLEKYPPYSSNIPTCPRATYQHTRVPVFVRRILLKRWVLLSLLTLASLGQTECRGNPSIYHFVGVELSTLPTKRQRRTKSTLGFESEHVSPSGFEWVRLNDSKGLTLRTISRRGSREAVRTRVNLGTCQNLS